MKTFSEMIAWNLQFIGFSTSLIKNSTFLNGIFIKAHWDIVHSCLGIKTMPMPQPEFVMNHVQIFRSGLRWPRWPIGPKRKVPFLMKSQKQDGEAIRWCLFLHTSSVAQVELPPIWIMTDRFFLSMANWITNYSTLFSPFVCFFPTKTKLLH